MRIVQPAITQRSNGPIAALLTAATLLAIAGGCRRVDAPAFGDRTGTSPRVTPMTGDSDAPILLPDMAWVDSGLSGRATPWDSGQADGDASAAGPADPFARLQPAPGPPNVILFIGDGMGWNQIAASSLFSRGTAGALFFESFSVQGMVTTHSADSDVTDSAASATAMATGVKVNNNVVSLAIPGSGEALPSITEHLQGAGKAVGLITTMTITHATPAGFGAHTSSRGNTADIAADYLLSTRPNVLFGGGGSGMAPEAARAAGYTVIETLGGFDAEALSGEVLLSGQFGVGFMPYEAEGAHGDLPHLWEMTRAGIDALDPHPNGFFLMVEGGLIDIACHANNLAWMVPEVLALERTVAETAAHVTLAETLIIVTADHATGGLIIDTPNGRGELPSVRWSTTGHTGEDVPIYVTGAGAEVFEAAIDAKAGLLDNTDIYRILRYLFTWA